jgi:hypothetical protein
MTCQRQTRNYRSLISETRLASLAILVAIALPPAFYGQNDTSGPPTEACSRDREYCVRMIETPHHPDECTLRVSANGRTIAEFPTFGYLLGVFFSPNNAYVAINNRRANAGDYLWVISLKNGQAIKMPDDVAEDTGKREAGKIVGDHWSDQAMPEIVALCPACTRDDLGHPPFSIFYRLEKLERIASCRGIRVFERLDRSPQPLSDHWSKIVRDRTKS